MISQLLDLAQNQFFAGLAGASVIGGLMYGLRAVPTHLRNAFRYVFTFEIEISNDAEAYEAALIYATRAIADRWYNRRFKLVSRGESTDEDDWEMMPRGNRKQKQWLLSPATGAHWTRFEGWPVRIHREITNEQHASYSAVREVLHLRLYSPHRDRLDRLVADLRSVVDEAATMEIYTRGPSHWRLLDRYRPRDPKSVVTPGNLVQQMIDDGQEFLAGSDWYGNRGIPYRRGWMLAGPPGTGKSSASMCVAGALGLPLYVLNLGSLNSDDSLIDAVNDMPSSAVLLLEDFDRQQSEKLTISALLNVLDGAMAREGRLLIITANHPEEIDPALVRPGRIDRTFEFGLSGHDEARELFARFYGSQEAAGYVNGLDPIPAAAIQAAMLVHKDNPEAAYRSLLGKT